MRQLNDLPLPLPNSISSDFLIKIGAVSQSTSTQTEEVHKTIHCCIEKKNPRTHFQTACGYLLIFKNQISFTLKDAQHH